MRALWLHAISGCCEISQCSSSWRWGNLLPTAQNHSKLRLFYRRRQDAIFLYQPLRLWDSHFGVEGAYPGWILYDKFSCMIYSRDASIYLYSMSLALKAYWASLQHGQSSLVIHGGFLSFSSKDARLNISFPFADPQDRSYHPFLRALKRITFLQLPIRFLSGKGLA